MPTIFNQILVDHQKRKKQRTLCDAFVTLRQMQTTDKFDDIFPQLQRQNRPNSFVTDLLKKNI